MRIDDRVWALFLAVLAVAVFVEAARFPRMAGLDVGPGLFPMVLSAALFVAAALLGVKAPPRAEGGSRTPLFALPPQIRDMRTLLRVAAVFGSSLLFATFGETLGFVVVGVLALGWLLLAFGTPLRLAVPITLVTVIVIDLFLVRVMRIPLPLGVLAPFSGWL